MIADIQSPPYIAKQRSILEAGNGEQQLADGRWPAHLVGRISGRIVSVTNRKKNSIFRRVVNTNLLMCETGANPSDGRCVKRVV